MESKAQKIVDRINNYDSLEEQRKQIAQELADLDTEENQLNYAVSQNDPRNPEVLSRAFDKYVSDQTMAQEDFAKKTAEHQSEVIEQHNVELVNNYHRFSSWFLKKNKLDIIVQNQTPMIYNNDSEIQILNGRFIVDCSSKGKYFLWVLLLLFAWPAVVGYIIAIKAIELIDAIFDVGGGCLDSILDRMFGCACGILALYYYFMLLGKVFDKVPAVATIIQVLTVLVVLFVVIQYIVAHSYFKKEADKYLAIFYPEKYVDDCFEVIISAFKQNQLVAWEQERQQIAMGGSGPLIDQLRVSLEQTTLSYTNRIREIEARKNVLDEEESDYANKQQLIKDEVFTLAAEAQTLVTDPNYNMGVITEQVALPMYGDDSTVEVLTHKAGPTVCYYDSDSFSNQDELERKIANFIGKLYYGLVGENYYGIIDYHLIDLDVGGEALLSLDPETRRLYEGECIQVIHSHERSNFYYKLSVQQEQVLGIGGAADIKTLNPRRLASGDYPLRYIIAVHYGKESRRLSTQELQFYRGGSSFGFIPIFIMSISEFEEILNDERNTLYTLISNCARFYIE